MQKKNLLRRQIGLKTFLSKNKNPTKIECSYCLHKESENGIRACNFATKVSCLTAQEQEKIDRLLSHFNEKGTELAQELEADISSIHFLATKFPNTGHIKLSARLKFECNTKDIDGLDYVLPTLEFDAADIPENLPQQIEQEIRQSQILWRSILKFLRTEVTCSAILECCKQQALQYQLEVKNFRLDRMDFTYRADEQKMTLERFKCHYNGEWHDGQLHYQNTRPWDNNYEQWIVFLYLSVEKINADTIDNLLEKFLSAMKQHFKSDFEHLVERTGPPHFSWDDFAKWWAGWGDEPPSTGSIEDIKEALVQLQEELTPGSTFIDLEVIEGNLEKIKEVVKSNFKKHALKLHPDKVGPQGEEKFKRVVSLYRKIEANYKARSLNW